MGALRAKLIGPRRAWTLLIAGVLAGLVLAPGSAHAAACSDMWTGGGGDNSWFTAGNWSGGVPTSSTDACIPDGSGNVVIEGLTENVPGTSAAAANTLKVGSGDLLEIEGTNDNGTTDAASLDLSNGGSVSSGGTITLAPNCIGAGCAAGAPSTLLIPAGTLTNQGTIATNASVDQGSSARNILGNVDNRGTIQMSGANLNVPGSGATITNDSGGLITNNGGTGSLVMGPHTTFVQGAGTTSPATANPAHPAVVMNSGGFSPGPTLSYTGAGASTIVARSATTMAGNLASGQNLVVDGTMGGCVETVVSPTTDVTNAGTITVTGTGCSGLQFAAGKTLTNTGTLVMDTTGTNVTRELQGSLLNSGTFDVKGGTAFDGSGATLAQTAGTTTIANGAILDTGSSGATFELHGGVLEGGGHTMSTAAVVNGPVDNTGGNVIPGSPTTPGLMSVSGNYTQGSGGKLTEVVDGAGGPSAVGAAYGELASGGNLNLGGTLAVTTVANPTVGDFDTVVASSGGRSGNFSTATGLFSPGSAFGYVLSYGSNYAALNVGPPLQVNKAGPGTGTVTSSPAGINCGSQCDAPFSKNQAVTLTAHPGSGSAFQAWSGVTGCGQSSTCQVRMTQAQTVTATFGHPTTTALASSPNPVHVGKPVTYTATITPAPDGGTVEFTDHGKAISGCGAVAVNGSTGKATCKVSKYGSAGTHKIQARYSGDGNFVHSTSHTLTETVRS